MSGLCMHGARGRGRGRAGGGKFYTCPDPWHAALPFLLAGGPVFALFSEEEEEEKQTQAPFVVIPSSSARSFFSAAVILTNPRSQSHRFAPPGCYTSSCPASLCLQSALSFFKRTRAPRLWCKPEDLAVPLS